MAVIPLWQCDRDGAMFTTKKEADEHDKMMELAANIGYLLEKNIDGINEQLGETIGIYLSKKRDLLARACKGKPEILLEESTDNNVTPLVINDK